ncbi:hypothetical protein LOTGIDRAFT_119445 [Lottia gigantea]|uniref:GPR158/179 extracellular domain-containing protein n=1 Tax=Lottia gigantea TaxID=225164 RepID=V4BW06_LOTGI|nr:hypothetical protein LOTGIDRAFT_119445 [Lottia gigantea]ESO93259.1 hypothetical protein LOTGIDRAFT_119445 [Lottia gigantea]
MWEKSDFLLLCFSVTVVITIVGTAPLEWMRPDNFDLINDKFSSVNSQNCRAKAESELRLPDESVAQIPRYNMLLSTIIYRNRSSLLHLHNMALNRAFFYSFVYQKLNQTWDFETQPGLSYIYMSAAADVSASPGWINGSALYFDYNCSYPNWYRSSVPFNNTLPLFGPRAWRADDYNEATNLLREPTNRTIDIHDYGAGRMFNYTSTNYKYNPWYDPWLPDKTGETDSLRKFTYMVGIRTSNSTGVFVREDFESNTFFGPPQPGQQDKEDYLPVRFTAPYFDCDRSNRWIVSATSPVVEYMPRYSVWLHLRRARFVAVSSMDIEFERIDMNQCPIAEGNPEPNMFAGTARCRPTTLCEPLSGFGFRRGGYQCACMPGYYFPWYHDGPFLGLEIEEATREEYEGGGFDCIADQFLNTLPLNYSPRLNKRQKRRLISSLKHVRDEQEREKRTPKPKVKMTHIMERKYQTNKENCHGKLPNELFLPGDVGYGVDEQFEGQGRTALRLAHFLSNFLQNIDEYEEFGDLKGDRRLNETQIFSEVIANVMSDFRLLGSGVFFDRYQFRMSPPVNNTDPRFIDGITREFFGPYAWREQVKQDGGLDQFKAIDFAGYEQFYTDHQWFRNMKARWATNVHGLKKYTAKPMIRNDKKGTSLIRFEYYPITYRAPDYKDGEWLRPQYKCDGKVYDWVSTYVVPFFGKNSLKTKIEFKGVVTVDVKLDYLDINQCPSEFHVPNAFKNTARCHYKSQYCVPLQGKRFDRGGYKCVCRQGYEYTFNDLNWYFDGQTMEEEYKKLKRNEPNRFETLKCRIAGASSVMLNLYLISILTFIGVLYNKF